MKIIAKQVPPEWQIGPVYGDIEGFYPGIIIAGNRHYNSYTTPEFNAITSRWDDDKTILRALHLLTRKRYAKRVILGNCQGDWQYVYYPTNDYSPDDISRLEIEYFNTGSEWIITSDDDPDGYSCYCYAGSYDDIRVEIACIADTDPENVTLLAFYGYTKTPKYREV